MDGLIDVASLEAYLESAEGWFFENVLILGNLAQLVVVGAAFLVARLSASLLQTGISGVLRRMPLEGRARYVEGVLLPLALPLAWLVIQWLSVLIAARAGWSHHLITIAVSLLTAWVVIRLSSNLIANPALSRFVAIAAWVVAALNIVGLLDQTVAALDSLALNMGDLRVSALTVIRGVVALAVLLWLASLATRTLERRIRTLPSLTPSVQELFSKLLKIVLITIAVVVALNSVGIDLTAFAVLSGAIGIGIGFGLQKVVSNLISGVILLLDKSIKPGDVIAVGTTYGWISSLGARYVSVVTRDGIEHLIPNEELIINRVENWSFSNNEVRLKTPIGISYGSDVRKAIELCLEAARETERVLERPQPACLLKGFGDSSVDLELRFWISDPQNGVSNVRSEVLLRVWDKFHAEGIEIPFPQRDLHLKTPADLHALARPEVTRGAAAE